MSDRSTLRGLLEAAWNDGWYQRGKLSNAPLGTRIALKEVRRLRFLEPGSGDVADERLFDAAPELLKAADGAWHLCMSLLSDRPNPGATDELIEELARALQAAIAKATGEAQSLDPPEAGVPEQRKEKP